MTETTTPADGITLPDHIEPAHPEPRVLMWTTLEANAIRKHAEAYARAAVELDRQRGDIQRHFICLCPDCVKPSSRAGDVPAGWISIEDRPPPAEGLYWTFSPESHYKFNAHEWLPHQGAWYHEWLRKKKLQAKPRTWITHWAPINDPAAPKPEPSAPPISAEVSEREAALQDAAYVAGALAGFNAATSSGPMSLTKLIASRAGYLAVLKRTRPATPQPEPAAQAAPADMVLVPREPTEAMRLAGAQYAECGIAANAVFGWRAMVAAAQSQGAKP